MRHAAATNDVAIGAASDLTGGWRPCCWLGAPAPGGLALPAAQPTARQLYGPRGVWLDERRLIVCDSGNHRLLIWPELPASDHASATVVLGQASFDAEGPAARGRGPDNGLHLPTAAIVVATPAGERLLVADAWHHRILVWKSVPTASDTPPDWCLGQPSLATTDVNRGGSPAANSLYWPYGLAWIAGRLFVADTGNRRVLVWNGLPDGDRPADLVLGQPDVTSTGENRGGPPGPASFRWPHAIAATGDTLLVADAGNHRVLGWQGTLDHDRPADLVLGQPDFTSATELPHRPQGPSRLRFPYGLAATPDLLAVADTANNRVLCWEAAGLVAAIGQPGRPAGVVLGQTDFDASGENRWQAVTPDSLCWPYGIHLHRAGDHVLLAVADSGNNRVMIWQRGPED